MNGNLKDENKVLESLIKLNIKYAIEDSNINLRLYGIKLQYYQNLLNQLENNKPLFFQKRKLIDYENKRVEYNRKIDELSTKMEEEFNLLVNLEQNK